MADPSHADLDGRIRDLIAELSGRPPNQRACDALAEIGVPAIPALVSALDYDLTAEDAKALTAFGATGALSQMLRNRDARMFDAVAAILDDRLSRADGAGLPVARALLDVMSPGPEGAACVPALERVIGFASEGSRRARAPRDPHAPPLPTRSRRSRLAPASESRRPRPAGALNPPPPAVPAQGF